MSTGNEPVLCMICEEYHPGRPCPRKLAEFKPGLTYVAPSPYGESMDHEQLVGMLTGYLRDEVFARRFADCMTMIRQKNADYTQGTAKKDRIGAFRRIGGDIDVPMTKVWAIFAQKHWGAVMKYVKDGQVESEPIHGRINDLINYFVLLGAIVSDVEGK